MESGPYLGNIVEHRINEHIYCTWARHQEWSPPPVIILERSKGIIIVCYQWFFIATQNCKKNFARKAMYYFNVILMYRSEIAHSFLKIPQLY